MYNYTIIYILASHLIHGASSCSKSQCDAKRPNCVGLKRYRILEHTYPKPQCSEQKHRRYPHRPCRRHFHLPRREVLKPIVWVPHRHALARALHADRLSLLLPSEHRWGLRAELAEDHRGKEELLRRQQYILGERVNCTAGKKIRGAVEAFRGREIVLPDRKVLWCWHVIVRHQVVRSGGV